MPAPRLQAQLEGARHLAAPVDLHVVDQLVILLACPDQPGIVARATTELAAAGGNVLTLEQHVEERALFFMRLRVEIADQAEARSRLEAVAAELDGTIVFADPARRATV